MTHVVATLKTEGREGLIEALKITKSQLRELHNLISLPFGAVP